MKELERKFLEVDRDRVISMLEAVGAKLKVDAVLRTVYFDTPDSRIKKANELLRLRTFGDEVELCWKDNMRIEEECKVYDEVEVFVSDFDLMVKILESLGYVQAMYFEKKRTEYVLEDGSKFEIDEFPGVPVFLEIEAESVERIEELASEFNLGTYEHTYMTGEELLRERYGVKLNGLRF